jgi:hypothetical protein
MKDKDCGNSKYRRISEGGKVLFIGGGSGYFKLFFRPKIYTTALQVDRLCPWHSLFADLSGPVVF